MIDRKKLAIQTAKGLALDQIEQAGNGHPGMPLGATDFVFELWAEHLSFNPEDPYWPNRDRYILSAGHASAMQYSLAYLFGYDYTLDDLKNFRQWGSPTPGHPDLDVRRGVEATTGPLGQGISMGVGMAIAERHLATLFNTDEFNLFDHYTYVVVGEGCLMEGVAQEASSLAGTLGLGRLIVLYDANRITIDGSADITFTEDILARYAAYGWDCHYVENGYDLIEVSSAINLAKACSDKPSFIEIRTEIGHLSPLANKPAVHGSILGTEKTRQTKISLGLNPDESFIVDPEVLAYTRQLKDSCKEKSKSWREMANVYISTQEKGQLLRDYLDGKSPDLVNVQEFDYFDQDQATRDCSQTILNRWSSVDPLLIGGSADLAGANKTVLEDSSYISSKDFSGKSIHFGIREHAMGAIANGLSLMGLHCFCATFFAFSDYMRYPIRMAALMGLPTVFIMTHDSVWLGEDGETHQPIEQIPGLRAMPNLWLWRPADGRETAAAYQMWHREGPSIIALSRQTVPILEHSSSSKARKGGYILEERNKEKEEIDLILIATGSEVSLALEAMEELSSQGYYVRVVSMPCLEQFLEQDEGYRNAVLPPEIKNRVAVEAASSLSWWRIVGDKGDCVSIERFGASAPMERLKEEYGFTKEHILEVCNRILD